MKRKKLRIGVDVDDVLYNCNQHAIDVLCEKNICSPLSSIYDITGWGADGSSLDARIELFAQEEFVKNQPIFPGAQEFIHELKKRADVIFTTAISRGCMDVRAERLRKDFPEVPESDIMIGARKDILSLDFLLDDGAHNILQSNARYPVLFRRPWNNSLTGVLSVNSFNDFIQLVDQIGGCGCAGKPDLSKGGIICIVGPTGSGKTELVNTLTAADRRFVRPVTTTTRAKRANETEQYHFVTRNEFISRKENGKYLETTVYGGEYFGAALDTVDEITEKGRIAVMPVDMCGAISIKSRYPGCTAIVFAFRTRPKALAKILKRDCSDKEKVLRILSLDAEYRNEDVCDFTVDTDESVQDAAASLIEQLSL